MRESAWTWTSGTSWRERLAAEHASCRLATPGLARANTQTVRSRAWAAPERKPTVTCARAHRSRSSFAAGALVSTIAPQLARSRRSGGSDRSRRMGTLPACVRACSSLARARGLATSGSSPRKPPRVARRTSHLASTRADSSWTQRPPTAEGQHSSETFTHSKSDAMRTHLNGARPRARRGASGRGATGAVRHRGLRARASAEEPVPLAGARDESRTRRSSGRLIGIRKMQPER
jgi:hypothetical protein